MSWEHFVYLFVIHLGGSLSLKARSVFVLRGLGVELHPCKAVVAGRGLCCLTLVILGLFPLSQEARGYQLIPVHFLCDVSREHSPVLLVLVQGLCMC